MMKSRPDPRDCQHLSRSSMIRMGKMQVRTLVSGGKGFEKLSVFHVTLPPRYKHKPLYHCRTHEWFYVLEGRTVVQVDGRLIKLRQGSFLYIAPGIVHVVGSKSETLKVLVMFSPVMNIKNPDICYPPGQNGSP